MRALGMRQVGEPILLDLPEPTPPKPDEVLVEIEMVALSIAEARATRGDRFRHFDQRIDPLRPFIFGFAGVGRIAEPGSSGLAQGQRVVLSGLATCGSCAFCSQGHENHCRNLRLSGIDVDAPGFARERLTVPARRVFPLQEGFALEKACVVSEVATAIHALRRGRLQSGEAMGVVGAGRHGRQLIRVAKRWGAVAVAIDLDQAARERARAAGADDALAPGERPSHQLDMVVHANSDEGSLGLCCDLAVPQGRIVLLGTPTGLDVPLPRAFDRVVRTERELIATDSKNPAEYREAIALMAHGQEDWDIRQPHRVPMADGPAALRRAAERWPLPEDLFIAVGQSVGNKAQR
jgi:threonine dehydrogenase-like Zn-dependent dehydrogenase